MSRNLTLNTFMIDKLKEKSTMTLINKTLKLAFIGGGMNSAVGYVHFAASQLDKKFNVVAGAFSRNKKDNIATAKYWQIEEDRAYNDWLKMLEAEKNNIDAVVVLTPTPDHINILKKLTELNIPTICEKSLVMDLGEIDELRTSMSNKKHFLAVTFNYSGYAMVRELKELIAKGKLGTIQKIHLEMPQEGFRRPPDIAGKISSPQAWRLSDGEIPTICLDLGVHLHHLSSFLLGMEPLETLAEFTNHSTYQGLIDDIQMLIKYPNNIKGSMWMSKTAIGNRNGLKVRIFGDEGSATWFQLNPDELQLSFSDGKQEVLDRGSDLYLAGEFRYNRMKPGHPSGFVEGFANLYSDIHQELSSYLQSDSNHNAYVYALEHAENGLKLFTAAKESWKKGHWCKV